MYSFESAFREPVLDLASRAELEQLIAGDDVVLPPCDLEQPTIEVETSISRRRSAFSRTMRAWNSVFDAVGTASMRTASGRASWGGAGWSERAR